MMAHAHLGRNHPAGYSPLIPAVGPAGRERHDHGDGPHRVGLRGRAGDASQCRREHDGKTELSHVCTCPGPQAAVTAFDNRNPRLISRISKAWWTDSVKPIVLNGKRNTH
jgi:hypothetical protein